MEDVEAFVGVTCQETEGLKFESEEKDEGDIDCGDPAEAAGEV